MPIKSHENGKLANLKTWTLWLGCVAIFYIRYPNKLFFEPNLWAEDASFLSEAWSHGVASIGMPLCGYFLTASRMLALVASWAPLEWVAHVVAFLSVAVASAVFVFFVSDRFQDLLPRNQRVLVVLGLASLTAGYEEALGNLANLHWWVVFAVGLSLLGRSRTRFQKGEAILLFIGVGSGGESLVYGVFALLKIYHSNIRFSVRRREWFVVCSVVFWAVANVLVKDETRSAALPPPRALIDMVRFAIGNAFLLPPWIGRVGVFALTQYVVLWWLVVGTVLSFTWRNVGILQNGVRRIFILWLGCSLAVDPMIWLARRESWLAYLSISSTENFLGRHGTHLAWLGWIVAWVTWSRWLQSTKRTRWVLLLFSGAMAVQIPYFFQPHVTSRISWQNALKDAAIAGSCVDHADVAVDPGPGHRIEIPCDWLKKMRR